jgi:hypothetical protein
MMLRLKTCKNGTSLRSARNLRLVPPLALLLAILLAAAAAPATTLLRMSLEKLSRAAAVIVRAQCLENFTAWEGGEIWTFTSFDVQEVWSGAAPGKITVRLLGGRVADVTSTVPGVPRFRPGEEVVLFLEPTPRGDFSIVSWQQGAFRIRLDAPSGAENVTQDTAAFATFDPDTRQFQAAGIRNLPLATFRAQVAAALRARAPRKP